MPADVRGQMVRRAPTNKTPRPARTNPRQHLTEGRAASPTLPYPTRSKASVDAYQMKDVSELLVNRFPMLLGDFFAARAAGGGVDIVFRE